MSGAFLFYIAGSGVAIGLIALLIHRLGYSAPHRFDDADAVRAAFLGEFPDAQIMALDLSADRTAALLQLKGEGQFGVSRAMGRFFISRAFDRKDIVRVQCNAARLLVHLRDYADPGFAVAFGDEATAGRWRTLLTAQGGGRP
jgi:hypothetical protein